MTTLCDLILTTFQHPERIQGINQTFNSLIPKVDSPEFVKHYRPISLCNVVYKCLTKTIVYRLKPMLSDLVSPFQASFISGRCIQDNILIAQEMIHSMRKMRGRRGFFAIKIDFEKAYDRLRWSFIQNVLEDVGITEGMKHLIMNCITSTTLNVM